MAQSPGYPNAVALSDMLRPRSIGDILDTTIRLYRRHFLLYFGIVMIVQALVFVVSQGFQIPYNILQRRLVAGDFAGVESPEDLLAFLPLALIMAVGFFVLIAVSIAGYQFSTGGLVVAVAETFLGRQIAITDAYRAVLDRFWSLLGAGLLVWLIEFAILIVGMLFFFGAMVAGGVIGDDTGVLIGALVGLVPGAIAAIALIYCFLWLLLTPQAVMLEDASAVESLRRSMQLMRERSERGFLRNNIFRAGIILLVVVVIEMVVAVIVQAPFFIAMFALAVMLGEEVFTGGVFPLWLQIPMQLFQAVGNSLVMPIGIIALILFYYDIRIRFEGFDLQVLAGALDTRR